MSSGREHANERHSQQPPPVAESKHQAGQGEAAGLGSIVPASASSHRSAGAKRGRSQGPVDLTEEQREAKRQRRLLQNRQSAAASRMRRKEFVESLRANEDHLKTTLRETIRELAELKAIMAEIPPHVLAAARQKAGAQLMMRGGRDVSEDTVPEVHLPISPGEGKISHMLESEA